MYNALCHTEYPQVLTNRVCNIYIDVVVTFLM